MPDETGRVIGVGGVFIKSERHEQLSEWYQQKLGLREVPGQGVTLNWRDADDPAKERLTIWSTFPARSSYFGSSEAQFMINYIVDDLDALLAKLKREGVQIDPKREDHDYGRFAWIFDLDGNKVELWEPPA